MMPRRNGYQVCRSLKADERFLDIPVVFLTSKDQEGDKFWGRDCGADGYLTKPFSAAKLEQVVDRLIQRRRRGGQMGDVTAKIQALKSEGAPFTSITFNLDPKALQVFRQKYGEMKYQEVLEGLGNTVETILAKSSPEAVIERGGESEIRTVLPSIGEEAILTASRVCMQVDLFLRSHYSRDDAERGYVVTRLSPEGEEINVQLLKVEATVTPEANAA
jgi:PleD family two-component response regulator